MSDVGVEPFDPLSPEVIADPWPLYGRLRDDDPVHEGVDGIWWVSRYVDVVQVLRDRRMSRKPPGMPSGEEYWDETPVLVFMRSMLGSDFPEHGRIRTLLTRNLSPATVERIRPRIVELVDELVAPARDGQAVDVIEDIAGPLPVLVTCMLLGLPGEDHQFIARTSAAMVPLGEATCAEDKWDSANQATREFTEYCRDHIARRRRLSDPGDDILGAMVAGCDAGIVDDEELIGTLVHFIFAGHETTTNLITTGLWVLRAHDDQRRQFLEASGAGDVGFVASAVEELLRYESPVHVITRWAAADYELGGRVIPAGAEVVPLLAAANRDPREFDQPDDLILGRSPNRHVAFGNGPHLCPGALTSRVEGQLALPLLVQVLGAAKLLEPPTWRHALGLRGLTSLRLAP